MEAVTHDQSESRQVDAAHTAYVPSAENTELDGPGTLPDWAAEDFHPLLIPPGGTPTCEPGRVAFGWCSAGLLVRFECVDSVVTSRASADNQYHYELGDTVEWFLKPEDKPYYWEFYATPDGYRTAMFWPGGDRRNIDPFIDPSELIVRTGYQHAPATPSVAAGWWAELLVTAELLTSRGDTWGPGSPWLTLAARYNHRVTPKPASIAKPQVNHPPLQDGHIELSSFPALTKVDFHSTDQYAQLRALPPQQI